MWEQEWTYYPTKGAAGVQARMQRQIEAALADLRYRGETNAATAVAAMIADNLTRLEITNAATRYRLDRLGGVKTRQGDARDLAKELDAAVWVIADLETRLGEMRHRLDGVPDLPEHEAIARRGDKALRAVYDLACLADTLHRAVLAEHGDDTGGPALSERLTDDPLDRLALDLAEPWQRHGHALDRRGRKDFMALLRAVHEAETGQEEIPERAEKRIRASL